MIIFKGGTFFMNNRYLLVITFFWGSFMVPFYINADVLVLKNDVEAKRQALNTAKTNITTAKIQADVTARDLKQQREALQQKIRAMSQDFKNNSTSLKTAAKK